VDYIMETFPIVKRKDMAAHGRYRTKETILDIYDAMQRAMETGEPYRTPLDPPPANGWVPEGGGSKGSEGPEGAEARASAGTSAVRSRSDEPQTPEQPEPTEPLVLAAPAPSEPSPARRPEPRRLRVNGVPCLLLRRRDTREGEEITVIYESDRSVHRFLTSIAKVEWE
jgi:hypothetical protein